MAGDDQDHERPGEATNGAINREVRTRPLGNVGAMFQPVDTSLDLVELERDVLSRWRDDDVFGESLRRREGAPEWVFYEGPPTANGQPGIHHVWARLFKDIYPRFQTMRGKYVARKGGWDCHGLPVEVQVEKELGFTAKYEIEDYGIARFNAACRSSVQRYVEDWQSLTSRIGMWIDTADAYWTLSNDYIESVWWLFSQLWDGGHVYEGFKVVPYCGRCGTALSSHELAQPGAYRDLTEPSVYVRFPLVGRNYDLLLWTTTPWTLPANVAAAVGPDIEYVRARAPEGGRDVVLAAARVADVLGEDAEVVGPVAVADLLGAHYERPFDFLPIDDTANRVVEADFVTVEDGTGIVHLAPAFGEIDREVGEREGLPVLNPVDAAARFTADVPPYEGQFVKDADPGLIEDLAARGKLVKIVAYTHAYPHCWRCDTPLIYWAKPTWFVRTSAKKDALLRENETINWYPEHIKHGRFGDWLENNIDWALSRDRYWGTPIPVWRCHDCGRDTCVGSVAHLAELAGRDLTGLDLHRPYVDDVTFTCPDCSGTSYRLEPVLDAWFDSGSMPAAQFHYPFEHQALFERRYPADFICEAIDQTRGWFYSLLAVNTLVFGRSPYRNVVCLAHIVDKDGVKMSKSRGNVIDPWSVLDTRGAEALRWYMFSGGSPWTPKRVYVEAIDEATRKFLLTLWNTYSFFVTYANLDGWKPGGDVERPTHVLDRWVRSRLHRTARDVTEALENFDALAGAQALESFVDDLSNWYVRRSRARFWKSSDTDAHATLYECLVTLAQVLAPFCPFVSDELYRNLAQTDESVHLTDWPEADVDAIDDDLETEMALAREIVTLGRAARNDARIGVRQPLPRAIALLRNDEGLRSEVVHEIAIELNVKVFEVVSTLEGLLDYRVVPNFRSLGPRVGKQMPVVKAALESVDGADVRRAFDAEGAWQLTLPDGTEIEITPDDVEIRAEQHEELALAQDGPRAVALDLTLDDDLRAEGIARELVRVINDLRKANGFEIADRIAARIGATGRGYDAIKRHRDWIAGEVLATSFEVTDEDFEGPATTTIDGEPVWVVLRRV
ncbi:MAG: Isoleucyl-tRNA synthetase [Actinomycetia bacterium]|nr:Isoleucyl-tRNA synthetase [Actinomycetes bacterium]